MCVDPQQTETKRYKKEITFMASKISAFESERRAYIEDIKLLKQKIKSSVMFIADNFGDLSLHSIIVNSRHHEEAVKQSEILEAENTQLRNVLMLNKEFNSFKSFEEEFKTMENDVAAGRKPSESQNKEL